MILCLLIRCWIQNFLSLYTFQLQNCTVSFRYLWGFVSLIKIRSRKSQSFRFYSIGWNWYYDEILQYWLKLVLWRNFTVLINIGIMTYGTLTSTDITVRIIAVICNKLESSIWIHWTTLVMTTPSVFDIWLLCFCNLNSFLCYNHWLNFNFLKMSFPKRKSTPSNWLWLIEWKVVDVTIENMSFI